MYTRFHFFFWNQTFAVFHTSVMIPSGTNIPPTEVSIQWCKRQHVISIMCQTTYLKAAIHDHFRIICKKECSFSSLKMYFHKWHNVQNVLLEYVLYVSTRKTRQSNYRFLYQVGLKQSKIMKHNWIFKIVEFFFFN